MKVLVFCAIVVLAMSQGALKAAIRKDFFEKSSAELLQYLAINLLELNLGNFEYKANSILERINLEISNTTIANITLDFETSGITFDEPRCLKLALRGLTLGFNYHYNGTIEGIRENGEGIATVEHAALVGDVYGYPSPDQALAIGIDSLNVTIESITVQTGLLINAIINEELRLKRREIEEAIKADLEGAIKTLNGQLENYPYQFSTTLLNAQLHYNPASTSAVSEGFIYGAVTGLITNLVTNETYPLTHGPVPDIDNHMDEEFQFFAGSYVLQSVLNCLSDGYSVMVTSLPKSAMIDLTTNGLAFLIPQLQVKYGKNKPVNIKIYAAKPGPVIELDHMIKFQGVANLEFLVENFGWESAVTLELGVMAQVNATMSDLMASVTVSGLQATSLDYKNSVIGPIETNLIKNFLGTLLSTVQESVNSSYASFEVPLPKIPFVKIQSSQASIQYNYLKLGATVSLTF